jgi:hypothetical protein
VQGLRTLMGGPKADAAIGSLSETQSLGIGTNDARALHAIQLLPAIHSVFGCDRSQVLHRPRG